MAYFPQLLFAFAFVNVALCDDILDFLSTDEMEMGKELFEFCASQTNAQRGKLLFFSFFFFVCNIYTFLEIINSRAKANCQLHLQEITCI